jgi:drug/metabolite transporter (DMT)-like permease
MAAIVALIGAVLLYSAGNLCQAWAAAWAERRGGVDPALLARLFADPLYVIGFGFQVAGFGLTFLASARLPLYLVQTGSAAAVGVSTAVGVLLLGWRVTAREAAALLAMIVGLLMVAGSAVPSQSTEPNGPFGTTLAIGMVLICVLAVPAAKLPDPRATIALGVLAGFGFATVGMLARTLASGDLLEMPIRPLFWLLVASAVISQALFAMALQRGTASAVAAMQASSIVPAAIVGGLLLGDQVAPERFVAVCGGLLLLLIGAAVLARAGKPARATDESGAGASTGGL